MLYEGKLRENFASGLNKVTGSKDTSSTEYNLTLPHFAQSTELLQQHSAPSKACHTQRVLKKNKCNLRLIASCGCVSDRLMQIRVPCWWNCSKQTRITEHCPLAQSMGVSPMDFSLLFAATCTIGRNVHALCSFWHHCIFMNPRPTRFSTIDQCRNCVAATCGIWNNSFDFWSFQIVPSETCVLDWPLTFRVPVRCNTRADVNVRCHS